MACTIEVNGRQLTVNDTSGLSLLSVLRDELGLTGARFGCGHGKCGACVVLVDEQPVPACTYPAANALGKSVVTIEGLAQGDTLHPVQRALLDEGALQCGYCTSGMILAAAALLRRIPVPSDEQIREALAPHLCRCGVYLRAIHAVRRAAQ
jgi:aerobic-type carbon monoxide dehydrogenase small subunit (CoxS/CutS family)